MELEHPDYPGLKIYAGEPKPGNFYTPKSGDALTKIAGAAYGNGTLQYALRINKSAWNMANCVYRYKSTSCSSKVVSGELGVHQKSFAPGAWLALCPADSRGWSNQMGLLYPVIWIPTASGQEPEDLAGQRVVDPGTRPAPVASVKSKKWLWGLMAAGVVATGYYGHKKGWFKAKNRKLLKA